MEVQNEYEVLKSQKRMGGRVDNEEEVKIENKKKGWASTSKADKRRRCWSEDISILFEGIWTSYKTIG